MEKSWHQKKRESLWSAGHQYSLWAPPLTFRFVAKPICLDLSRVLPRVAFGPPALGFPPNLSQSPNPPILNWRHNHPTHTNTIIIIITTRPKPAYGRQGLAGSWGQDTDKVSNFWVFLTSHFAQLGIKPTWDHSWRYKSTWHHENQTWSHNKNMKNQPGTMKNQPGTMKNH